MQSNHYSKHSHESIGIFDSGIGGIAVLQEIIKTLPNENIIYLGDNLRNPYGTKPRRAVKSFFKDDLEFLLKSNVKLIIPACNTIMAITDNGTSQRIGKPVLNIVDLTAKWAVKATKNKRVGVLATVNTIRSKAYTQAIRKRDSMITIYEKSCSNLIDMIEHGQAEDKELTNEIETAILPLVNKGIDTLVLGCTHYSLLSKVFKSYVEPSITLIDSALSIADELKWILEKANMFNDKGGNCECFFTGNKDKAEKILTHERTKLNGIHKTKIGG